MAEWNAKQAKIEEATRKKENLNNIFAAQTKEALEAKMEQYEEKREALITDMKEKLKIHAEEIEKTRQSLENKKDEERKAIEEKLKAAESMREENIKKKLERLKEHVSHFFFFVSVVRICPPSALLWGLCCIIPIYLLRPTNRPNIRKFFSRGVARREAQFSHAFCLLQRKHIHNAKILHRIKVKSMS